MFRYPSQHLGCRAVNEEGERQAWCASITEEVREGGGRGVNLDWMDGWKLTPSQPVEKCVIHEKGSVTLYDPQPMDLRGVDWS
ncbi:hypothetical protein AVEN_69969-1 [Araneus ventricosus]|uniref:Uncharacterized protein n=1 Tax=Araneus ventricosus TaxID=182803 RepID=A0A4Y2TBK5_ARAVE|nr:hypothetical protein AVEN_69969-1 [Araneus ventricosus]